MDAIAAEGARTRIDNITGWTGRRDASGRIIETGSLTFSGSSIGTLDDDAPAEVVIDGGGGFLCPAFADGHVHPLLGGLEAQFAKVRDLPDPQAVARSVGEWARAHPEAEWVRGEGFDTAIAPGAVFHAEWLDAEVPDRPVVLRGTDYHTVWVNSEALRRVGYSGSTSQPHDGEIVLDARGEPIGTLREWGAWRPVYDLLPPTTTAMGVQALAQASARFAAAGIAWVQDAWVEPEGADLWLAAVEADVLGVRADLALFADSSTWRDQLAWMRQTRTRVQAAGRGVLSATTIKFFADGVIESGTAALLEPYHDCPHVDGMPNWDPAELAEAVAAVDALGFAPHIHAIGDAAVRSALDAIEHAIALNGVRNRRPVIAHTQLVAEQDMPRFAELGVIANFQPYWARLDPCQTELTEPRLGPNRAQRQYRMRSLLDAGAAVSFGSDWPVSTYAPLEGIAVAVHRSMPGGPPWMPQERISVDEALLAYTAGVAYQGMDANRGVLESGARADLVLLAQDPRSVEPERIGSIEVLGTWCGGLRTHG